MNYRHAFHAGNFADVVKHVVVTRILLYLCAKESAFRIIDTHAGAGLYDLAGEDAARGGEWQGGIGRVIAAPFSPQAAALIRPYLDIVRAFQPDATSGTPLRVYPGSPLIARALMRPQDRMNACEVEPGARAALIDALRRDMQARVVDLDGWLALNAFIPPRERRGLVVVDPPFERADEFEQFSKALAGALHKWPGGLYLAWYPVKDARRVEAFVDAVGAAAPDRAKILRIEIDIGPRPPHADGRPGGLSRAGLLAINAPFTLKGELDLLMPELAAVLAPDGGRWMAEQPGPPRRR